MISPSETAILDEVGCWKVIWIGDLYRILEKNTTPHYTAFCRIIRGLEKKGHLAGRYFRDEGKYVYLTEKGALRSSGGTVPDKQSIDHDLICTEVILKLLEFGNFTAGGVPDGEDADLCPDGMIQGHKNGTPYTLAIEVELTQKSRFRIEKKFIDYTENSDHSYALYIIKRKSLFENYKRILTSMEGGIQKNIILSLTEKLGSKQYDFRKAVYCLEGKQYSFDALFGEKKSHVQ